VNRTGPALFVALLVASAVAAAVVVHARTPDLALQVTGFTKRICPQGGCKHRVARLRFYVRESDSDATVEIVGPDLKRIRTLYRGPLVADRQVSYTWNGRNGAGAIVNARDRYRLRVILPNRDRNMVYPRRISIAKSSAR
jgi:hypothetical protein